MRRSDPVLSSPPRDPCFFSTDFIPRRSKLSSGISRRRSSSAPVVGILGGIGSGKSSVVKRVEGLKIRILDADRIGHELLSDPVIVAAILERFGKEIADEKGKICRSALADRVFGATDEHKTAKRDLEALLHPGIRQEIKAGIRTTPPDVDVVILDAALLLEAGWDSVCDILIFIDAPEQVRRERVMRNRNWPPDELRRREATQFSIEKKKQAADYVVDNSESIKSAADELTRILRKIVDGKDAGNP
ncbi:MAG: dephospho-CoA kinase [Planctomycetaceae bacterium]